MYVQGSPVEIQIPADWNLIANRKERLAACVITQQYSSSTLVSLRFHSSKEEFGADLKKMSLFQFVIFIKLRKSEIP